MSMDELETLADTMFKDMPDNPEKKREQEKLAEVKAAHAKAVSSIKDSKAKFALWGY